MGKEEKSGWPRFSGKWPLKW